MREETKKRRQTTKIRKRTYKTKTDSKTLTVTKSVETSPERAESVEIVREMTRSFIDAIEFYKAEWGGGHSHDEAVEKVLEMDEWRRGYVKGLEPEKISWGHIAAIAQINMGDSSALWVRIREAATEEFVSGRRAGKVTGSNAEPYTLAQFFAIRDSFADQWKPQGGIEWAMIDMLVISYSLQMYWSQMAYRRSVDMHVSQEKDLRCYKTRGWKSPYQYEADAVDQAERLADSYNRQFLRVLRQLRDLRRYTVVIQNNGGQVNVGNQQIVQQSNENSNNENQN